MAKGSKSRPQTRDTLVSLPSTTVRSSRPVKLTAFEDRRTFDFEEPRPARLFTGSTAKTTAVAVPKNNAKARARVPYQIAFTAPPETLICVRRKTRREVLFAKNKGGKRGQKRPRRSAWSNVKC